MQDYNTIIGVIQLRQNNCSFSVIEARYHIGSGTAQRILNRFDATGFTLDELRAMEPHAVEDLIYPPQNLQRKDTPMPDFQHYYDRIHAPAMPRWLSNASLVKGCTSTGSVISRSF